MESLTFRFETKHYHKQRESYSLIIVCIIPVALYSGAAYPLVRMFLDEQWTTTELPSSDNSFLPKSESLALYLYKVEVPVLEYIFFGIKINGWQMMSITYVLDLREYLKS